MGVRQQRTWTVLLIGGNSKVAMSEVSESLGKDYDTTWMRVNDILLALRHGGFCSPDTHPALYPPMRGKRFTHSVDELTQHLVGLGRFMSPVIDSLVMRHLMRDEPIIIEGDCILPARIARQMTTQGTEEIGRVRSVFIIEPDATIILTSIMKRNQGPEREVDADMRTEAQTVWQYGQWLTGEANQCSVPVIEPRPFETLHDRIFAAITS